MAKKATAKPKATTSKAKATATPKAVTRKAAAAKAPAKAVKKAAPAKKAVAPKKAAAPKKVTASKTVAAPKAIKRPKLKFEALPISTPNCTIERAGHIMIVTLNRPEAKNALSSQMILGMYNAWRLLDSDPELRVAVLTGKGDTFCSGMDLKSGTDGDKDAAMMQEKMKEIPDLHWQALLRHNQPKKPIIMAVEGYALAGGTEILQGTDIRVAAKNAIFGVTECKRGLFPLGGSTIRLRRQIPYCLAAEILLLGRHISAQEALDWGLINRIVPKGKALEAALEIAREIAEDNGPLSIQAITKSLRDNQQDLSEKEALANEEQLGWPVFMSADAKEGMKAFKEKRKPVFTGQ